MLPWHYVEESFGVVFALTSKVITLVVLLVFLEYKHKTLTFNFDIIDSLVQVQIDLKALKWVIMMHYLQL